MWWQLRPGTSTYFASGMCSAMYLPSRGDEHGVGVVDDKSRHTDGWKDRPHVQFDRERPHQS